MATFAQVRESLDELEEARTRAEIIVARVAELNEAIAKLEAELEQIRPDVSAAEAAFRASAAALDINRV